MDQWNPFGKLRVVFPVKKWNIPLYLIYEINSNSNSNIYTCISLKKKLNITKFIKC